VRPTPISRGFEVRGLGVCLGGRALLTDLSVDLSLEGVTALVGRSGSGKSLLCQALVGLVPVSAGSITLRGLEGPGELAGAARIDRLPEAALARVRRAVPLVLQGAHLLEWRTVAANVHLAAPGADAAEVERTLALVGLAGQGARAPRELGPAHQKLAAVARALMLRPRALILDEPTTGLDPRHAGLVWEALAGLSGAGLGLLVVSHDLSLLDALASRVVELTDGALGYVGHPAGFKAPSSWSRAPWMNEA
jgi:ABC-type multidrug transport system ATPase subunit